MKSPVIGITSTLLKQGNEINGVYLHREYQQSIIEAGGIPIILPSNKNMVDKFMEICDGFILSGGEDVDPIYYNEHPHEPLGITNEERDEFEIALIKKIVKQNKPLLAICRGMHILNVALGGTLIQDIPNQLEVHIQHFQKADRNKTIHVVDIEKESKLYQAIKDTTFKVNSLHHQCIDVIAEELQPTAFAADEVIEGVEHKNAKYILGVQWHPESMSATNKEMKKLFKQLVDVSMNK